MNASLNGFNDVNEDQNFQKSNDKILLFKEWDSEYGEVDLRELENREEINKFSVNKNNDYYNVNILDQYIYDNEEDNEDDFETFFVLDGRRNKDFTNNEDTLIEDNKELFNNEQIQENDWNTTFNETNKISTCNTNNITEYKDHHPMVLCRRLVKMLSRMKHIASNKNLFNSSSHPLSRNSTKNSNFFYEDSSNQKYYNFSSDLNEDQNSINNSNISPDKQNNTDNTKHHYKNHHTIKNNTTLKNVEKPKTNKNFWKNKNMKNTKGDEKLLKVTRTRRDSGIEDDIEVKSTHSCNVNNNNDKSGNIDTTSTKDSNKNNTSKSQKSIDENAFESINNINNNIIETNTTKRLNNKILHLIFSRNKFFRSASTNIEDFFNKDKFISNRKDTREYSLDKTKGHNYNSINNYNDDHKDTEIEKTHRNNDNHKNPNNKSNNIINDSNDNINDDNTVRCNDRQRSFPLYNDNTLARLIKLPY